MIFYSMNVLVLNYFGWMEIYARDLGTRIRLDVKDIILNSDHNIGCKELFTLNLFVLFGKYHIHESRWTEKSPRKQQFKREFERNIGTLKELKSKKKQLIDCKYAKP